MDVAKYKPVPRTLSDAVMKIAATADASVPAPLVTPQELRRVRPAFPDPQALFRNVSIRPAPPPQDMRSPQTLFGEQALAQPGSLLLGPTDLLPNAPKASE